MPPASCFVGPYRTIVAFQFRLPESNARCGHLHCPSCRSDGSDRRRVFHEQLSSRVIKRGVTKSELKWSHGRYRRPFGGYSPSRARGETAPESEDAEKLSLELDKNSNPGSKARSLVGTYAASTALAVQESLPPEGVIVLLACLVGVLTGFSVVLFNLAVDGIHDEVWEGIPQSGAAWLRTRPLNETWLQLLAVPFGGGVLVGILNTIRQSLDDTVGRDETNSKPKSWGSKSESKSTRLADVRGVLRAFLKAVGAAVTLGTGCSLGPEGPSVEIGASIANGVGTVLSNSRERKLSLVAAGSAAGISSGFNAAVAGCFFALESVLRPSSSDSAPSLTTAMLLLSSVLASVISQAGLGSDPAFKIPAYDFRSPAGTLGLHSSGTTVVQSI